jgi:hypothetical protein
MSTATPSRPEIRTLVNPDREDDGFKTIDAPDLISFEKPGQRIAGTLVDVSRIDLRGKKVVQYVISTENRVCKLLGTYDLVQKLDNRHIGCMVRILYRGEDPEIKKGDNHMKIFHVMIKGTPAAARPGGPITDEDIPF